MAKSGSLKARLSTWHRKHVWDAVDLCPLVVRMRSDRGRRVDQSDHGRIEPLGSAEYEELQNRLGQNARRQTEVAEHEAREGARNCCGVLAFAATWLVGQSIVVMSPRLRTMSSSLPPAPEPRAEAMLQSDHGSLYVSRSYAANLGHHGLLGSMEPSATAGPRRVGALGTAARRERLAPALPKKPSESVRKL
jgi:hypothetical protein